MHTETRIPRFAFLSLCLIAAVAFIACTAPAAPTPAGEPTTPGATAPAASTPQQEIPIADFVQQHETVSREWDEFHGSFDEWSASLSACHPNAMREALNEFAVSFNSVTVQARGLTRGKTSGELADLLIVAAEEEETALRQLRDRWQPNNIALFENVEQQRSKASQAQKSAVDRAIELRDGFEDTVDPEAVDEFQEVFGPIRDEWKQLHEDFETLSGDADDLGAAAVREGIEQHAASLEGIIDSLEELPELDGAEETVEELLTAAKAELEAFESATDSSDATTTEESANGTGGSSSESTASDSSAESESADTSASDETASTASDDNGGENGTPDLAPLDAITEANAKVLKQANKTIEDLADTDSEEGLAELQVFDSEYVRLLRNWDAFHDRYNDWRKEDGGCDRAQVIQDLEQHSLQIGELAREIRSLPSVGQLLPIYSLLTEAAARDENAIRTLRYTWQPFALDAFKAVHQERMDTENLRRQAEIAVQELANRS